MKQQAEIERALPAGRDIDGKIIRAFFTVKRGDQQLRIRNTAHIGVPIDI